MKSLFEVRVFDRELESEESIFLDLPHGIAVLGGSLALLLSLVFICASNRIDPGKRKKQQLTEKEFESTLHRISADNNHPETMRMNEVDNDFSATAAQLLFLENENRNKSREGKDGPGPRTSSMIIVSLFGSFFSKYFTLRKTAGSFLEENQMNRNKLDEYET